MSSEKYKLFEIEGGFFTQQNLSQVDAHRAQKIATAGVAVLKDDQRFIDNLVTKDESWQKPTYDNLRSSLKAMQQHTFSNSVQQLAIPRTGCGIDGREWDKVRADINEVFSMMMLTLLFIISYQNSCECLQR
ncbi:ADP-ribose glycohydrolase OARD1-like [Glossina fuscipes fuscipes]